ncbi:MAG: hypothetical protein PUE27_03415 [Sharpea porci]|uniref:hypothetical protein n=1 Tax=Sharpea porci TaxID=2652286 RepID=UPI002408FD61|nr:hypothetical protein [Sharpea porci]MDD6711121.1 hypothetical protein [Sharpea porci]
MLYAIIWFVLLVILYIGTYLLNKHTKAPEDCQTDFKACQGCANIACGHYKEGEKK